MTIGQQPGIAVEPPATGTFRIFILGAGFSRLAGLPLGAELFELARHSARGQYGEDNHLESDLKRYVRYRSNCEGREIGVEDINYEEFLGFLDIEHFLGLRGKDTWSSEGNESQLIVRKAIGQVLEENTPSNPEQIPPAYRRFARRLTTTDWVLTFNYDTLLEKALDAEGVPYRLFPNRYSRVGSSMSYIDSSREEVVLLKLHGSIDWFDRSGYEELLAAAATGPIHYEPKHPVFGPDRVVDSAPLVDGPRNEGDPLKKIHRVNDLRQLSGEGFWRCAPLLLAPSSMKLFYSRPLHDFWRGMQGAGGLNLSLGIIGYSLPEHDSYARQAIYSVARNFTEYEPELELNGRRKSKLRIINLCADDRERDALRRRYQFINWERAELWDRGFDEDAVDWVLR